MTIQAVTDPRIADLKHAGKIRVALYTPQYAKDQTGELRGWTIELGRALAERIGVEFAPVEYPTPPKAMEALKTGLCDVGFGAMEGSRTSEIDFSPAVVQFDFTYLVPFWNASIDESSAMLLWLHFTSNERNSHDNRQLSVLNCCGHGSALIRPPIVSVKYRTSISAPALYRPS